MDLKYIAANPFRGQKQNWTMTLREFISAYDKKGSVVLLEGKRHVAENDREKLTELGRLLASNTTNMIFRSGNADGADHFFSLGITAIDRKRLQVITPYSGHRSKSNQAFATYSLDDIDLAKEPAVVYGSKQNRKTDKLVDRYISGERNRYSVKAAYIIRDTVKAIGAADILPAGAGIFYDDPGNPMSGGTGHTMRVCLENNIPVFDQSIWFKWLENS